MVHIDPVRDFGGWGYRIGRAGRTEVVLQPGEAVLVHRSGGRELVVTVDDAHRGAARLTTLAERSRPTPGPGNPSQSRGVPATMGG